MFHCVRCAGSYTEKNANKPIVLVGKGTDGLKGIQPLLENDVVVYALLRVVRTSLCHACKGLCGVFKQNTVYTPSIKLTYINTIENFFVS